MSPDAWGRAREIFEASLEVPAEQREAFARARCGDDSELLAEVLALIDHDREAPEQFVVPPTLHTPTSVPEGMILGGFRLVRELGRGAMGIVYLGEQTSLARRVAIKVLSAGPLASPASIERFHREARSAARLDHPNIVRVLDDGSTGDLHWFAMEYVPGRSLDAELERQRTDAAVPAGEASVLPRVGEARHIAEVARIVADLASALAHAHSRGVVHRDVKPSNVLVTPDAEVKLVDFGIARDESFGTLTKPDQLIGSAPYMSPEQAHLIDAKVDQRTDVYSLGVVLYELLTLRRPYQGATSIEVLHRLRTQEPRPLQQLNPRVPRDLGLICATAMAKAPTERYQDATALEADLRRFIGHEAILAKAPSWLSRARRLLWRRRSFVLGVAACAVALVVGALWSRHTIEAHERSRDEVVLAGFLAREAGNEPTDTDLYEVRAALTRARASATKAGAVLAARVDERLEVLGDSWLAACKGDLAHGRKCIASGTDIGSGFTAVLEAFARTKRIAQHFPAKLQGLDTPASFAPRLDVRVDAATGGRVGYRLLDPRTAIPGPTVELGPLPIEGATLPVGFMRLVVELEGGELREYMRNAEPGADLLVEVVTVGRSPISTEGMVLLERAVCAPEAYEISPLHGLEFEVEPFWIDRSEVSVREYREFLTAVPDAFAPHWLAEVPPGSERELLPMVDVPWSDALRYAEWRGVRLVAHHEWIRAARGPGAGRPFPWGAEGVFGNVSRPHWRGKDDNELVRIFFEQAMPVASMPDACTPEGVFHLFGNVAEWTESPLAQLESGVWEIHPHDRLCLGGAFDVLATYDMRFIAKSGVSLHGRSVKRGFRCAKSATF